MTISQRVRAGVVVAACLVTTTIVGVGQPAANADSGGDAVQEWNLHTLNAVFNPGTAAQPGAGLGAAGMLSIAMAQAAVYDAVIAIEGGYEPYLDGLPDSPDASTQAAVATAAYDVLLGLTRNAAGDPLFPAGGPTRIWLDPAYQGAIAAAGGVGDPAVDAGIALGAEAAEALLGDRVGDGRFGSFTFVEGTDTGEWRSTGTGVDAFGWLARVRPFLVERYDQFPTEGPHPIMSDAYEEEYAEVKALGSATSTERTAEQTATAIFYRENVIYAFNGVFREIADAQGLDAAEQARLFGMTNLIAADAVINCWDDKARWSFWRPFTAIRTDDGNPDTETDPSWTPLGFAPGVPGGTPPYPDHPSGLNCLAGAFMRSARMFFGSNQMPFTVHSRTAGTDREYQRFSDVLKDTIDARVYLGIHFRTADVQAVNLGRQVAVWAGKRYFQPTG